jgi:hypothetical protein
MRNDKGQFLSGVHHNEIWNIDSIYSELKDAVQITVDKFGFAPPFVYFRNHPEYGKITSAIANRKLSRSEWYKKVLDELGYDYPEKKSGYYLDGNVFRGFYEFVAFCFMKAWGVNIDGNPKVFENYLADGYLVDYNIYWEHWGGLNKRNDYKKEQYLKLGYNLISTYDDDCSKKGVDWFYTHLKELLLTNGVDIKFNEGKDFSPLDLITGKVLKLEDIYNNVKSYFGSENPRYHTLSPTLRHQVTHYFSKFSTFVKYCNKHFNETWVYEEKTFECNDVNYCVRVMSDLIKTLNRFPTVDEMRKNGFQNVVNFLPKHGGTESFKRNLYEAGENYHLIHEILGDSAPYDKLYDFSNEDVFKWAVSYITKKLGKFPQYQRELKKHSHDDVCMFFYLSIRKNGNSKYKTWGEFQVDYFGDDSSSKKKFLGLISYEDYKNIRQLIESGNHTLTEVIKLTNSGWGTIGRIKNKHPRFNDYSIKYECK